MSVVHANPKKLNTNHDIKNGRSNPDILHGNSNIGIQSSQILVNKSSIMLNNTQSQAVALDKSCFYALKLLQSGNTGNIKELEELINKSKPPKPASYLIQRNLISPGTNLLKRKSTLSPTSDSIGNALKKSKIEKEEDNEIPTRAKSPGSDDDEEEISKVNPKNTSSISLSTTEDKSAKLKFLGKRKNNAKR